MKRNACMLKVIGADQALRTAMDHEHPVKGWMHQTHSSSRPDRTQTRPITQWVIMHYAPMIAVRNHLLQARRVLRQGLEREYPGLVPVPFRKGGGEA